MRYFNCFLFIFLFVDISISGGQTFYREIKFDSCSSAVTTGICSSIDSGIVSCGNVSGPIYNDIGLVRLFHDGSPSWIKRYSFNENTQAHRVQATLDGGFVILAQLGSLHNNNIILFKVNSSGVFQWGRKYNGLATNFGSSILHTKDNGFIISGYSIDSASNYRFNLIRTDSAGILIWNKIIIYTIQDEGYSVAQTNDGGFIITGNSWSGSFLSKTDSAGNVQWTKAYYNNLNYPSKVLQSISGEYYFSGQMDMSANVSNGYFIKADSMGNIIWYKQYHNMINSSISDFMIMSDTIYASGGTWTTDEDALMLKIDTAGNFLSANTYSYSNVSFDIANQLLIQRDGIVLSVKEGYNNSMVIIKTDLGGNIDCNSSPSIMNVISDTLHTTILTDSVFTIMGFSNIVPISNTGGLVLDLCQPTLVSNEINSFSTFIENPITDGYLKIRMNGEFSQVDAIVFNSIGENLFTKKISGNFENKIEVKGGPGIYFVKIVSVNTSNVFKVIKL